MSATTFLLAGVVLLFVSGAVPLVVPRGRLAGTLTLMLGAGALLVAAALALQDPGDAGFTATWSLPFGSFAVALDATSAVFLLPIALVPALGAVYGHGYMDEPPSAPRARWGPAARVRFFYGVLAGSLALLVAARDSVLFLLAWEGMALGSFFLITTDDRDREARSAGWIYLIATHVGTLALFALFALLRAARGDTLLEPLASGAIAPGQASVLFALGLVGFGLKAGLMPLHVWLPPAHAAAPSHVSAVLSGVVTKMGIYGLVRLTLLLPDPPLAWGTVLTALGSITAVAALAFAMGQGDMKRMLAYSTIENIGVITIGLGLALVGRSLGEDALVVLGLGGALLHVLAHALMKTLLFLAAGAVIHATGTRQLDRLGGLAAHMPVTAALFALGALAICALPPLSGFASELVIYLGLFEALDTPAPGLVSLAAPALALTGALALAAFVRVFGVTFLGAARSPAAAQPHESPRVMLAPMALAALFILLLGLMPMLVLPLVDPAIQRFAAHATPSLAELTPLGWVTGAGLALIACIGLLAWLVWRRAARVGFRAVPTWDCGYAAPSARMQYGASSFGASLIWLFEWLVRPQRHRPDIQRGPFPSVSRHAEQVPDLVLDRLVLPAVGRVEKSIARLRVLQQGRLHMYILYIFLAVLGLYLALGL